jgi:hypothetical protein
MSIPIANSMVSTSSIDICVRDGRDLPKLVSEFLKQIDVDFRVRRPGAKESALKSKAAPRGKTPTQRK